MRKHWRAFAARIKRELDFYQAVARNPGTPRLAKWLLALAIGYLLLPFDLIPDWIPALGVLDDIIIVPGLVWLALRLIPEDVLHACRTKNDNKET